MRPGIRHLSEARLPLAPHLPPSRPQGAGRFINPDLRSGATEALFMKSAFLRNALVLGMLSAIGPFAIDMYLPAFPAIARDLQVDVGAVQMSLMSFFLAVSICQIIYGPISDRVGRKPPLYFGLSLFIIGGIGCGFAGS